MDRKISVNHLSKDMLSFELRYRGLTSESTKSVDEMRAALRPLLQLERQGVSFSHPPYFLEVESELQFISKTLKNLQLLIPKISGIESRNKFLKVQTQLLHLSFRLDYMPASMLTESQVSRQFQLSQQIETSLSDLKKLLETDRNLSAILEPTHLDDTDSDSSNNHPPVKNSTPIQAEASFPCHLNSYKGRVEKWNLKFTGDNKQLSIHHFLERASELRLARGISEQELFESAIDLFAGKALTWYRANRNRFHNWKTLTDLLCKHFEPPDYRPRLFREILDRTQDASESIVDYLANMNGLFQRYGNMSEDVQLDIISRNLSPFYITQLPVVNSLAELETECLKLEAKKYRADHYVPPSRRRQQFVEPDFAFIAPSSSSSTPSICANPPSVDEVRPPTSMPIQRPAIVCWNCNSPGHPYRACTLSRKLLCFRCGTPNFTVKTCPKCNTSENSPRERK